MVDLNPLTPTALVERMARAFGEEDWWALLDVAFPCSRVLQRLARHHLTPSPSDQLIPLPPEVCTSVPRARMGKCPAVPTRPFYSRLVLPHCMQPIFCHKFFTSRLNDPQFIVVQMRSHFY